VYMLNMLFDFSKQDGLFSNYLDPTNPPDPLKNSRRWLKGGAFVNPPNGFDPERQVPHFWTDLERWTLYVPKNNPGHTIAIRIAPEPNTPLDPSARIDFVAAFGRPLIAERQQFASPFESVTGNVLTTFIRNLPSRAAGTDGWYIELGNIAANKHAPNPDVTNRFEFALGIIVTQTVGGVTTVRHFGEDPEEDVGG
jgi:hypothetical protein